MQNKSVREIILSGLFIALGLILPMIFHSFGSGSTFLPMHIPVLIAGFVVSLPFALAVGAITPIVSSLLTGMPPAFPVLPFMVFELATYGAMASFLYQRCRLNVYVSLLGSMIAGRIMSSIVVWALASFFMAKLPGPLVFITGAIAQGIPGIVIQILFVPAIVFVLQKNNFIKREGLAS